MRTESSPYHMVYSLLTGKLNPVEVSTLIQESIDQIIMEMMASDHQIFHSALSRLQFLFSKNKLPKDLFKELCYLKQSLTELPISESNRIVLSIWIRCIAHHSSIQIPQDLIEYTIPKPTQDIYKEGLIEFYTGRVSVLKMDATSRQIEIAIDDQSQQIHVLKLSDLQESKTRLILQSAKYLNPPYDIYVHNLSINENAASLEEIIILPDYLVDVTSIAACYSKPGSIPLKHLIQIFTYNPTSYSALVGTTVNQFLDELILNPRLSFEELSKEIFHPLAFSLLNDTDALRLFDTIKFHFENIQKQVHSNFQNLITRLRDCQMEPSFYSIKYGIQGRLDLYYEDRDKLNKIIIELKSGKPYSTNEYGINHDHHAQIMLYYLLIQSVFGDHQKAQCLVLYSSQAEYSLREAPGLKDLKQELIYLRNAIILIHLHLAFRKKEDPFILDIINEKHFSLAASFTKKDALTLLTAYQNLNSLEKDYFQELCSFIAREQLISKLGRSQNQYTEGLASLWLLDVHEKRNNFSILDNLRIKEIHQEPGDYPILILEKREADDYSSNFRTGDTLVMYSGKSALQDQIFKCNLILQHQDEYHIRLRTYQFPDSLRSKSLCWNLEHDSLDRSFLYQYQGLVEFARSETKTRQKILGLLAPDYSDQVQFPSIEKSETLIQPVLKKILQNKDYFLLWGPPGSGKTSYIIRYLVDILNTDTPEHVLLLAYTNRAVDEICEAIESIQSADPIDYIRIGSRFAVAPKFTNRLLEEKIKHFTNRKQLLQLVQGCRIFTATIASIQGKKDLFYIKKFDTVIIDEASQILESQLTGLLTRFTRFILIGDHMQLPAVTSQTAEETEVHSGYMRESGLTNLNMSLFERLLKQAIKENWNHAYEMLNFQGRMHKDIMKFPSKVFYNDNLRILPETVLRRHFIPLSQKLIKCCRVIAPFLFIVKPETLWHYLKPTNLRLK
jgi:DNA replication ATP-dependent helicase Dna2